MDILLDNPLASMYGPYFMVFYTGFSVITLLIFGLIKTRIDQTDQLSLPPIPPNIDPYEIAFLRGGTNEVARSVIFSLMQKGLIEIKNDGNTAILRRNTNQINQIRLDQVEEITLDWLGTSRDSKEIFQKNGLITQLESYGQSYAARLERQQMLVGDDLKSKVSLLRRLAILSILSLGIYKIIAALSHGKWNVFGIIIVGSIGAFLAWSFLYLPRLTKLGRAYTERLQLAFENLKIQAQKNFAASNAPKTMPQAAFAGVDPLLLSVGVFGTGILAGTLYSEYNTAFTKAQHSAVVTSSCSSGCGSCSSGSSSCNSGSSCSSGCSSGCGGGCGGCS